MGKNDGLRQRLAFYAHEMGGVGPLEEGTRFATVGLETRFLAPVKKGVVTAHARAAKVHDQGRTYRAEVEVQDDGGNRVALFNSTFKTARGSTPR